MNIKERPILFSAPMVRAILAGTKTQTRRVVRPQPSRGMELWGSESEPQDGEFTFSGNGNELFVKCPYGAVGSRLWVRETWQVWTEFDGIKASDLPEEMRARLNYPADGNVWDARLRPSLHMPRWASRITLEITKIRVERLNDISNEDAAAEGAYGAVLSKTRLMDEAARFERRVFQSGSPVVTRRAEFAALWESINGEGSWDKNPWGWVIEFKRVAS